MNKPPLFESFWGGYSNLFFSHALDNLCQNAHDVYHARLIIDNNWPIGKYCQWILSAEDENFYITLVFQNINVSKEIYLLEKFFLTKVLKFF